jgi:hypothetical protein
MMISRIQRSTLAQKTLRILLGLFLLFAGIGHLTFVRKEFLAQVPPWLPVKPDLVVILSGIVEILLGAYFNLSFKSAPQKKDNNENNSKRNQPHTPTHAPAPRIIMHHFIYFY